MFKPLDGVKVIDLTYFVAGPGAARILADWGADVIKVEPSFGDPGRGTGATMSCPTVKDCNPFYTAYNANKRGLSLNLKSDEGKAVLYKLLESADVFVSSYRTGALRRLGLDYDSLSKKFPHLIWAQINGFGDFGPAKDNAGFDTVAFWARSGAMIDLTEKDTSPINPLIGFGDATTSCSLSGGICAALYHRTTTGLGEKVDCGLLQVGCFLLQAPIQSGYYGKVMPRTRYDPNQANSNTYQCSDGEWIFLAATDYNRQFPKLCKEVFNRPDLLEYVSCAPLPKMNEDDPYYSAEATHIPLVVWQNSEHPEICQAFIEYLYQTDNYLDFLAAVPVGMLPSIKGIDENEEYLSNSIVQQFSDEAAIITEAVNEGTAIGFEHGPSAQAGLLANQGIIEEMFQDIITNGTDVETAAKAAEDELNEIFATMVA